MCRRSYSHTAHSYSESTVPTLSDQREGGGQVRASDEEREAVTSELRRHAAAGRLSVEELDQRVEAALAARERGQLDGLLADLPRTPGRTLTVGRARRAHLRTFVMVNAFLIVLWALTGGGPFWPAWPLLGWGFWLVMHSGRRHMPPGPWRAHPGRVPRASRGELL
jgi:hypothetical protein